jgi:diguanylate cyclase (GGDEF)-like protein
MPEQPSMQPEDPRSQLAPEWLNEPEDPEQSESPVPATPLDFDSIPPLNEDPLPTDEEALESAATDIQLLHDRISFSDLELLRATKSAEEARSSLELARIDPLTGLSDVKGLDHLLESRYGIKHTDANFQRENQRGISQDQRIAMFHGDMAELKVVNDMFGHDNGDKLLVEVGKILSASFRETDIVARYGGDEFLVIVDLPATWTDEEVEAFKNSKLQELRQKLSSPRDLGPDGAPLPAASSIDAARRRVEAGEPFILKPVVAFGSASGRIWIEPQNDTGAQDTERLINNYPELYRETDSKQQTEKVRLSLAGIALPRPDKTLSLSDKDEPVATS